MAAKEAEGRLASGGRGLQEGAVEWQTCQAC